MALLAVFALLCLWASLLLALLACLLALLFSASMFCCTLCFALTCSALLCFGFGCLLCWGALFCFVSLCLALLACRCIDLFALHSCSCLHLPCQALAGTDVVNKTIDALVDGMKLPDRATMVLLDLFGYDGFSAEAILNRKMQGLLPACIAATICHSHESAKFVKELVSRCIYHVAKAGTFQIDGFPVLKDTVEQLKLHKNKSLDLGHAKFAICSCRADGTLLIPSSICNKWLAEPTFMEKMTDMLTAHNVEFNQKGLSDKGDGPNESLAKKPRLEANT